MRTPRLVLASGSETRRALLAAVNLAADIELSGVDENISKRRLGAEGAAPGAIALALAEEKARAVLDRRPGDLVLGADQILECGGRLFDKPRDRDEARAHLRALRGEAQVLHTAVVLLDRTHAPWRHLATPRLRMRAFGDDELDAYLAHEGEALCQSVGACRIEGPGYLLFEAIEGEHAAILGLPLLALGAELRRRGIRPG